MYRNRQPEGTETCLEDAGGQQPKTEDTTEHAVYIQVQNATAVHVATLYMCSDPSCPVFFFS